MTDNEIIKALEDLKKCNNGEIDCDRCSLSVFYPRCPEEIGELSLDLITRQQAIVEKSEKVEYIADKTIATLQAENEELKSAINGFRGYEDKIKAKAYKECIEKVEKLLFSISIDGKYFTGIHKHSFDNLVKEMEGDDND